MILLFIDFQILTFVIAEAFFEDWLNIGFQRYAISIFHTLLNLVKVCNFQNPKWTGQI